MCNCSTRSHLKNLSQLNYLQSIRIQYSSSNVIFEMTSNTPLIKCIANLLKSADISFEPNHTYRKPYNT